MKALILFMALAFAIDVQSQVIVPDSTRQVHQIDSAMKLAHQRGIFNGNMLVALRGKVIYQKSFGHADGSKTKPLDASFKFDIGSISKEFNGVAILLLAERGKLSLTDSLAKYFPALPEWAKTVRISHLINYTSAIPTLGVGADSTDALIYENLTKLKSLAAEPGTVYIYNNVNVVLQRGIIEKVSGQSYADFVRENLLDPAGMMESIVDYPFYAAGMARAFDEQGKATPYTTGVTGWVRLPVADLYRWITALHGHKIISAASIKTLAKNFPGGESSLGTVKYENGALLWHQHQGSNYNYEAAFYHSLKDGLTIVMMTNNQQMKVWPLKTSIVNILTNQSFTVPKKSLYLSIRDQMLANVNEGIALYQKLKATGQDRYDFGFEIGDLISTGKYLQRRSKFDDAIRVFDLAVKLDAKPNDRSYGYELIGECYRSKGDVAQAITHFKKAIETDPLNKNAAGQLQSLAAANK